MASSIKQELLTEFATLNAILLGSLYGAKGRGASAFRDVIDKANAQLVVSVQALAQHMALSGLYPEFSTGPISMSVPQTPGEFKNIILFRLDDIAELINDIVLQETDEPEFDALLVQLSVDTDYMKWLFAVEEF